MKATNAFADRADFVLRSSFEVILVSGGDDRMRIQHRTGFNKYGCMPRQRDVVPLGSCTASSPTRLGIAGAREALFRLRSVAGGRGEEAVDREAEQILEETRQGLKKELGLEDVGVKVALCPSGTDAEYLALTLVQAGCNDPVVNIISGPFEVGGGTTSAAAGLYFLPTVPNGGRRVPEDPIDDTLSEGVTVKTIGLRDDRGVMLPSSELDRRAEEMVTSAIESGARILLHIVAHSKTGVHAPSLKKVSELRERFGDRVSVLIDAAQGRVSRRGLREALTDGFMVIFTGSKFYGGPAFSGALLVPQQFWPENTELETLSSGLSDFMSATELPRSWHTARASLPRRPNLGLVLRWNAALALIRNYYDVPAERRLEIMHAWETDVPHLLGHSTLIRLVPVDPIREQDNRRLLESKTTVFPFFVYPQHGEEPFNKNVLARIFCWLNRDISGLLPELPAHNKAVLARSIHIGQPVVLSGDATHEQTVLRVALGGVLIIRLANDSQLAPTYAGRLNWLRAQIEILREKIELIVENLDHLFERESKEPGHEPLD